LHICIERTIRDMASQLARSYEAKRGARRAGPGRPTCVSATRYQNAVMNSIATHSKHTE
jgi:hypothetical protein